MKIVNLQAENFRILKAIEIAPDGNVVTIGGKNGQGKSSVLDAIWVALAGRSKAPPTPIRKGEEKCRIALDLGEILITRTFTAKEGGTYTDSVKVESADGKQRFTSPQGMLNDLMGQIGFDPLDFVQRKPEDQADMLLELVPLPIDLEELAREDTADYANRRDINREAEQLTARIAGIAVPDDVPNDAPDRNALTAKLAEAADHNTAIERDRMAREQARSEIGRTRELADTNAARAKTLREQADSLDAEAASLREDADALEKGLAEREPLAEPIDTEAVRRQLQEADATLAAIEAKQRRAAMVEERDALVKRSEELTAAMEARETRRREALQKARMPIEGLGFAINEKGKPVVLFNGLPFGDASSAEQIRASTAIAMAANPELRVLRIKDGSLLDDDALKIIGDMADAEDFQLWVEKVGTGGVGIVIEDGAIKGAPEPAGDDAPAAKPKAKKAAAEPAADKPDGALL